MASDTQQGYAGQAGKSSTTSDYNKIWFLVRQLIGRMCTATVVRVESVSNSGGVSPIGTVSVTPLVNLIDGLGNATEHGVISNLPYMRVQGGQNAIILDPQVGDIGVVVFAMRDISAVKASGGQRSNPGSRRRYDWADGVYLFSIITQTPNQFVQLNDSGVTIQDKNGNSIVMSATGIVITGVGPTNVIGTLEVNGVPVIVP